MSNKVTNEFQQVQGIISLHRLRASQTVNNENLRAAWEVGAFVSARLKNSAWGSKTVMQLSEYLRAQDPTLRGYSRRSIYKMVSFYDAYSSVQFAEYQDKLKLSEFVQTPSAQIVQTMSGQLQSQIVQSGTAQIQEAEIVQPEDGQIVPFQMAQFVQSLAGRFQYSPFVQPLAAQFQPLVFLQFLTAQFVQFQTGQIQFDFAIVPSVTGQIYLISNFPDIQQIEPKSKYHTTKPFCIYLSCYTHANSGLARANIPKVA